MNSIPLQELYTYFARLLYINKLQKILFWHNFVDEIMAR